MSLEGSLLVPVLICLSLMTDDQSKGNSPLLAKWVQDRVCDSILAHEAGGKLALRVLGTVSLS